jgi:hypothetical protein
MKSNTFTLRLSDKNKRALNLAAHEFGTTLTQAVLFSVNQHFVKLYIEECKRRQTRMNAMVDGEQKEAERVELCEILDKAEYLSSQRTASEKATDVYKEIEALETYRDFLRETVTA